jgi:hypothetical protein
VACVGNCGVQVVHGEMCCGVGERANALLTVTFKTLRRVSLDPWRIGKITQAALVLLHREHDWTPSASHNVTFGY